MQAWNDTSPLAVLEADQCSYSTVSVLIQVDSLKETTSSLQAELEVRAKDKQVAETAMKNAEALKRQADGVAQEYDRLLEENDKLRSLLGRVDNKYAQVEGKKSA
jgi:FtsZ-binding cell division protein ZapB